MKRGEAVCRIVYVSGPKVFKMKLKEVKAPPRNFDYVKCVPIRDNHKKQNQFNVIEKPRSKTSSKSNPKGDEKKTFVKESKTSESKLDSEVLSNGDVNYSKKKMQGEVQ
jgi:uncharacterized protein YycO